MTHLFPLFIDLSDKSCLVIGGGRVAERKVENLLEYNTDIIVVSPEVSSKIQIWHEKGLISWKQREFVEEDIREVFMVFVATNDNVINHKVADLCRQRGILVNAVDDPPNCDFYVPSVIRRGSLALAISTEGKSPLFAKRMRQQLEEIITEEYGEFVEMLGEQRGIIKQSVSDIAERERIFSALVDSDILALLKAGEKEKARERIRQCMSSLQE